MLTAKKQIGCLVFLLGKLTPNKNFSDHLPGVIGTQSVKKMYFLE